jgi:putative photosynthetic complex assembly protein
MKQGRPMPQATHNRRFPRSALIGAAALILFSLAAAGFARLSGIGTTGVPDAQVVASRVLLFEDRDDGAVIVREAEDKRLITVLAPGTNGFVRGVMRGFARERRREDVRTEAPFLLARWSDGRFSIEDAATHERIELVAFGPTNEAAFAHLLYDRSASR